jgi:hypothetical protein
MTFFLDREGKVIAREIGVQGGNVYVEHMRRFLRSGTGSTKSEVTTNREILLVDVQQGSTPQISLGKMHVT